MNNRWETGSFKNICYALTHAFVHRSKVVRARSWQSTDITKRPEMTPHELLDCTIGLTIPGSEGELQDVVKPNLPWAEDHFKERVSGEPLNPPPSEQWWPFNTQNHIFKKDEKFSHTYPERFWPKFAGADEMDYGVAMGVRFEYGDLAELVEQLRYNPTTRQAYLPVWFPEDTGLEVRQPGQRVPCTLGYHFIYREDKLHCIYYIRSCDFMRHFRDDVYMACRLTQWICGKLDMVPGRLTMHITSFHVFEGDLPILRSRLATDTR